jgi:hypothetical protein
MAISPTAEGFRSTFRQPSFALAEIAWRWVFGATAVTLCIFGFFEYLDTLRVSRWELLFLRTKQPFLVAQAIAHILRGSLYRVVMSLLLAFLLLSVLWIVAASVGRIATVRALTAYFRGMAGRVAGIRVLAGGQADVASDVPSGNFVALLRLNFLRIALAVALILGLLAADIIAGFVSTPKDPEPGLAFIIFVPLAALVFLFAWVLNWLISLAGVFAARDRYSAIDAISSAVTLCRERAGSLFAVSTWTGLAHLVAFVGATTAISMAMGFMPLLPWRLVMLVVILLTIAYFAVADWLYMARLAGYVCILEIPEALMKPAPPVRPAVPPASSLQTTIDRDELILSDVAQPVTG